MPLRIQVILLFVIWLLLLLLMIPLWDYTYWDFGDGNYLYVGQRILDGLVPYRDILAPQPPLHLIGAALSQAFGALLFDSQLIGARIYAYILRVLASLLVYLCTQRLFGCSYRALIATIIYLLLPIGFWWSIGVQSENIEIVFLLLAFWQIMRLDKQGVIIASIGSALAMHCNMTAVPYFLCNALFLGARRPRLFLWYFPLTLGIWGIGAALAYAWAGGDYIGNVVLNQVGSFPKEEILGYSPLIYFRNKIINEGFKVLLLEGPSIAAAIAAIAINWYIHLKNFDRKSDEYRRYEYVAWYSIGMMLSIGFVMKGGTVNYIFILGEPAVAIFAADTFVRLCHIPFTATERHWPPLRKYSATAAAGLILVAWIAWLPAWSNIHLTLTRVQVELPPERVENIAQLIATYTEPGDPILAPPYYAWATNRTVAAELAENYLWQIKYVNDVVVHEQIGEGVLKMQELATLLRTQQVPLVLLDLNQTGRVPEIAGAIDRFYVPLDPPVIHTRNTQLGVYLPANHPALAPQPRE